MVRSRWAAIGAAVAVSLGAGGGIAWFAHADSAPSTFVGITPCRLFDTRSAAPVGDRTTPLLSNETFARQVWGTNGACTIPTTATGIAYNLTVPDPTVTGFVKLYPGDAAVPNASAINPVANGGTKANSGIVGLSATGGIKFFNQSGPLDALLDITGYFVAAGAGATGPAGAPGAPGGTGPMGVPGARGLSAWDVIPSGQTVTGNFGITEQYSAAASVNFSVSLPARAPTAILTANVNFAVDASTVTTDDDATCTGTAAAPTAPAGKVCLYPYLSTFGTATGLNGFQAQNLGDQAFYITYAIPSATTVSLFLTWAYTAP
jgi:hypothetical protein